VLAPPSCQNWNAKLRSCWTNCTYYTLWRKSVAVLDSRSLGSQVNFKNDSQSFTKQQWDPTWMMLTEDQGEGKDGCWDCEWKNRRIVLPMCCYPAHARPTTFYIHLAIFVCTAVLLVSTEALCMYIYYALHWLPSINDTNRFLNYATYMAMTDEIVLCSKSTVFTKTENTQNTHTCSMKVL